MLHKELITHLVYYVKNNLLFYHFTLQKKGISSLLKNVDKKLAHLILDEIVDQGPNVCFTDVGKDV